MHPFDLSPDLLSRLRGLSLTPRAAAALVADGQHASRNRGGAMEFAQYRAYERGDDLRRIDWKLYSRSDRFFVRDAERESPVALWVVLDASASMGQADAGRPDWTRFDAARRLIAAIIEVALRQGDRFGVVVAGAEGADVVPPSGERRHRDRIRLALAPLKPHGVPRWEPDLKIVGERIARGDLVIFVSDGFDDAGVAAAERLAMSGRDVAFVQLLTGDERDFPFDRSLRFRDPESGAERAGEGRSLRDDFLSRFAEARAALRARLEARGVRFVEHFSDRDPDRAIQDLSRPSPRQ